MVQRVIMHHGIFAGLAFGWLVASLGASLWNGRVTVSRADEALPRETGLRPPAVSLSIAYIALTTLTLPTILKSGAAFNYLSEWMYALTVAIGFQLTWALVKTSELVNRTRMSETGPAVGWVRVLSYVPSVVFIAFAIQVELASPQSPLFYSKDREWMKEYQTLMNLVASTAKPVISDDMVILLRDGKQVYLEPAIVAETTSVGLFDESNLLRLLAQLQFAFIITEGGDSGWLFHARYSPAMRRAILKNYPAETELAGFTIHKPQP